MGKNTKQIVDINLDDMDDIEIIEEVVIESEVQPEPTEPAKPKSPSAIDIINAIKASAPEMPQLTADKLTPKQLDEIFHLTDGGRTCRRYLRKYFADKHIKKEGWNLDKKESIEVIAFFTTRFGEPDFTALTTSTTKEEA